jgi:hypothetical protein
MKRKIRLLYLLTLLAVISSFALALTGLVNNDIYTLRINHITKNELLGQDLSTFLVSLIFLIFIVFRDYDKIKTKIVALGFFMYIFYMYAYFSFGGVNSVFYLAYIFLTALSLFLFFFTIFQIVKRNNLPTITEKYPAISISIFLFLSVFIVGCIEIAEIVDITVINIIAINPFNVYYVLDLAIIFPLISITAFYNFKKSQWGFLFSGIALIKIATILPAVIMNDVFHKIFTGSFIDLTFDIIATVITIVAVMFLNVYFRNIQNA